MTKQSRAKRIADLNDKFRKNLVTGGRAYMTAGVNTKGPEFVSKALAKVIAFDDFNADNDPHREHDFGSFELEGKKALLENRLLRFSGRVRGRRPDRPQEDAARPHRHARRGVLNSSCPPRVFSGRGASSALQINH
jgi:Protein of unknown function (DUF3768)